LATGGTALAAAQLVEKVGGVVAGFTFVVELDFLKGRERLGGYPVYSLIHY
jgi:adenine phosphoribosyltransferase